MFLTCFSCLNFAFANDVNGTDNVLADSVSVNGNSFADIQKSINSANSGDTIKLNANTYVGNGTQIIVNKSLTFDGTGSDGSKAVLDANDSSRIFYISGNYSVVFKNIIFQKARVNSAGCVIYQTTGNALTLTDCDIKDCYNRFTSNMNGYLIRGATYSNIQLSRVNVFNVSINSTKYIDGFFISAPNYSKVRIVDLNFYNNLLYSMCPASHSSLGAIVFGAAYGQFSGKNICLRNNTFICNGALGGLGFYTGQYSRVNVSGLKYEENYFESFRSESYSCGVYAGKNSVVDLNNVNFTKNQFISKTYASSSIIYLTDGCTLNMANVSSQYNTIYGGSQIVGSHIRTTSKVNSTISSFTSQGDVLIGGEIFGVMYFYHDNTVNFYDVNISKSVMNASVLFYGGGIYCYNRNKVVADKISYSGNKLYSANTSIAMLIRVGTNSTYEFSHFDVFDNLVQAVIHKGIILSTSFNTFNLSYINIHNNRIITQATYAENPFDKNNTYFPGLILAYGNGIISDCVICDNYLSAALGLGIQISPDSFDNPAIIENCVFINNTCGAAFKECNRTTYKDHGGAICVSDGGNGSSIIRNCLFVGNINSQGGAITPHNNCIVENCRFINNTATKFYGGAISTEDGFNINNANVTIRYCYFEGNGAPIGGAIQAKGDYVKIYNCTFKDNDAVQGGAVFLEGNNLTLVNCTFIDNNATHNLDSRIITNVTYLPQVQVWNAYGGAVYIHGDNAKLDNNVFLYNSAIHTSDDSAEGKGGAIYIYGDNATLLSSYFDDNFAHSGNGSAIYVLGINSTINMCEFYNHDSGRGTLFVRGSHAYVLNSIFKANTATRGGAGIYSIGNNSLVDGCLFENNNATIHGGAIHSHGDYILVVNSKFISNNAHPNDTDLDKGLGGAIYTKGDFNDIAHCEFDFNTARNGSAIYNRGNNLTIEDCNFHFNQAYSYNLFILVTPEVSNYSKNNKIIVNITHIGGDNIINAIYNDGDYKHIFFLNVTYEHSSIAGGKRNTGDVKINPVASAEESNNGELVYQDSREDLQVIDLIIAREIEADDVLGASISGEVVEKLTGRTGLYGNISFTLSSGLKPGKYNVYASHKEDRLYKGIQNNTRFEILPHVDLKITKSSDKDSYFVGDIATFKITVTSLGTDASNVIVNEILPESFKIIDAKASKGTFKNNVWSISNVALETSETLVLKVKLTKKGSFTNIVNVSTSDNDTDLSNNHANKTVKVKDFVDLKATKTANVKVIKIGGKVIWTITVTNQGTLNATNVKAIDRLSKSLKYLSYTSTKGTYNPSTGEWNIGDLNSGETATLTLTTKVLKQGKITNVVAVTSSQKDKNMTDNKANFTITINKKSDSNKSDDNNSNKKSYNKLVKSSKNNTGNPLVMLILALIIVPIRRFKK